MAISLHCRRIRIQSRPHFINPFQDQTTEQVEWSWLTELQAVLLRDNSCSRSKNTGCVCAPLTFLRSELACVCTPYRCGCVSTSVCVSASRFLPYYWLSAAFRLRFQLCWVTPSFSAPWSLFFFLFIPGEWGGEIKNFVYWFEVTRLLQKKTCANYKPETKAKTHSRSPLALVILLTACFPRKDFSSVHKVMQSSVQDGRLPNTHPTSGLRSPSQTYSLLSVLSDNSGGILLILSTVAWISKTINVKKQTNLPLNPKLAVLHSFSSYMWIAKNYCLKQELLYKLG